MGTELRCGGKYYIGFVDNLIFFRIMKKFWKSVRIWQSYGHEFLAYFFWPTLYVAERSRSTAAWRSVYKSRLSRRLTRQQNNSRFWRLICACHRAWDTARRLLHEKHRKTLVVLCLVQHRCLWVFRRQDEIFQSWSQQTYLWIGTYYLQLFMNYTLTEKSKLQW